MSDYNEEDEDFTTSPMLNASEPVKKSTPLTSLEALLSKTVEKEPVTLEIPGRPGFKMRFNTNIDSDRLQAWQHRATRKKGRNGKEDVDGLMLATIVLSNASECLILNGEDQTDSEGDLLTLTSIELAKMLGVDSTSNLAVIRALYGFDGHIIVSMQEVLSAAGFDSEVELGDDDPTERS